MAGTPTSPVSRRRRDRPAPERLFPCRPDIGNGPEWLDTQAVRRDRPGAGSSGSAIPEAAPPLPPSPTPAPTDAAAIRGRFGLSGEPGTVACSTTEIRCPFEVASIRSPVAACGLCGYGLIVLALHRVVVALQHVKLDRIGRCRVDRYLERFEFSLDLLSSGCLEGNLGVHDRPSCTSKGDSCSALGSAPHLLAATTASSACICASKHPDARVLRRIDDQGRCRAVPEASATRCSSGVRGSAVTGR